MKQFIRFITKCEHIDWCTSIRRCGFTLILVLSSSLSVLAQETISVTGTVKTQDTGEALPGASVVQQGTTNGTVTDTNGNYSLPVSSDATLVISFIGYTTVTTAVGGRTSIDIVLEPDTKTLEEIVVVGYGAVKKSDVTGAVVSLKSKDLTPGALVNVEQTLQGRVAGVQISQTSGEPGAAMNIKIRGVGSINASSDPLYVIDGMPVNNIVPAAGSQAGIANNPNNRNPLNGLNPSDIESIEVLKDASATAIYGSRGTNGVVLITTKRGSTGGLKVGYNVQYGVQKAVRSLKLLTGQQYHDILNAIIDAGGGGGAPAVDDDYVNTDWQNEVLRTASIATHDINISGGKDNTKFYTSLGYYDQDGVMKNSGTERYTLKLNLENAVPEKYAVGINLNTSYISDQFNSIGLGINENGSALYAAYYYDPTTPVFDDQGKYFRAPSMGTTIDHPLALLNGQYAKGETFRTFGSIYGEYFILPSLTAKIKIAGDVSSSRKDAWIDPSTLIGLGRNGNASIYTGNINYYLLESTLNYNRDLNENHSVNALLGTTYEHFGSSNFTGDGQGYAAPDLTTDAIGSGNPALNRLGSGQQSSKLNSYFGRVNYIFKNKYLLTASIRADGSSRFGQNNRYGYFPSTALAWKVHEESFLSGIEAINEVKVRVGYGVVGNQAIGNYRFMDNYSAVVGSVFGGTRVTGFEQIRLANPDLKWESSAQSSVGIDFGLFNDRLTGTIEYWQKENSDLLLDQPVPTSAGFASRIVNAGSMKNTGFDIFLSGEALRINDFSWNLSTNISFLKNKVIDLGGQPSIIGPTIGNLPNVSITRPGEPINSFYGYEVTGVWQTEDDFTGWSAAIKPGDLKFRDINDDKNIDANDRVILGSSIPKATYGFTSTFTYKAITLSAFFEGSRGGKILNELMADAYYPVSFRRNRLAEPYLNRWTPDNPTNEYPSFVNPTSQGNQQINSRSVESADYLRLQSLQLSYSLAIKKGPVKNVRVFVTGQNLYLWTKYSGIDPAVNATAQDVIKVDYSTYPMVRTFLGGVNIQF